MPNVSYLVELTIQEGKLDEFKRQSTGYVKQVQDGEPGTLAYQWHLAEDGTRCLLREVFDSSESLLAHLGNVGPTLPDLLAIAPITRLEVFGPVSEAARGPLADLGAQHFTHLGGFER